MLQASSDQETSSSPLQLSCGPCQTAQLDWAAKESATRRTFPLAHLPTNRFNRPHSGQDSETSVPEQTPTQTEQPQRMLCAYLELARLLILLHVALPLPAAAGRQEDVLEVLGADRVVPKREPRYRVVVPDLAPPANSGSRRKHCFGLFLTALPNIASS